MKTYLEYLTEGTEQSRVVNSLSEIVNDWRSNKRSGDSVSFNKLFGKYADDPIIGSFVKMLFDLTNKLKLHPVLQFVPKSISDYQKRTTTVGGFDPKSLSIHFFVDPYDLKSSTVAHELSHLYDFVMAKTKGYDNQKSYIKSDDDISGYVSQEYEVRARFYGAMDNHTNKRSAAKYNDPKFIESIVTSASIPDIFKNKYRGLAYKILKQIDEFGLDVVKIIHPEKVVRAPRLTKMEQLEKYIKEVGIDLKITRDNTSTTTIELDNSVLSQATEKDGTLNFPILDNIVEFYKGNSKVRFVTLEPSIYYVLTTKYGLTPYKNNSNYRVNDSFIHFKHRKLKTDELSDSKDFIKLLLRNINKNSKLDFDQLLATFMLGDKYPKYFDDEPVKSFIMKNSGLSEMKISNEEKTKIYNDLVSYIISNKINVDSFFRTNNIPIPESFIDAYLPNFLNDLKNYRKENKDKLYWESKDMTIEIFEKKSNGELAYVARSYSYGHSVNNYFTKTGETI